MRWLTACLTFVAWACASNGSDAPSSSGGNAGSAGTGGSAASAGAAGAAGAIEAGSDAAADAAFDAPVKSACEQAGGICQCAGTCDPGHHPAPNNENYACPQPCNGCGGCSMWCCVPDEKDAAVDAGCEGIFTCFCGTPVCVDGGWECEGSC